MPFRKRDKRHRRLIAESEEEPRMRFYIEGKFVTQAQFIAYLKLRQERRDNPDTILPADPHSR